MCSCDGRQGYFYFSNFRRLCSSKQTVGTNKLTRSVSWVACYSQSRWTKCNAVMQPRLAFARASPTTQTHSRHTCRHTTTTMVTLQDYCTTKAVLLRCWMPRTSFQEHLQNDRRMRNVQVEGPRYCTKQVGSASGRMHSTCRGCLCIHLFIVHGRHHKLSTPTTRAVQCGAVQGRAVAHRCCHSASPCSFSG